MSAGRFEFFDSFVGPIAELKEMRKKQMERHEEDPMPDARVEPTFEPESSTKLGTFRTISVDEYKKQMAAVKQSDANADKLHIKGDMEGQYNHLYRQPKKSAWRKMFSATIAIALVSINAALIYVELQPKALKPTFSVATPWGTAEVLTPWGPESEKIAQLNIKKIFDGEKSKEKTTLPNTINKYGDQDTKYQDSE